MSTGAHDPVPAAAEAAADALAPQREAPAAATGPDGPTALRSAAAWSRLIVVAAAGLAVDLLSKEWAFATLRQGGGIVLIPHVLEFRTMLNKGALFGIGAGLTSLFLAASFFALALVVWMFVQSPARRWVLHVALGAILAGAMGNMVDRATVRLVSKPLWTPRNGQLQAIYMQRVDVGPRGVLLEEYPSHPEGLSEWVPADQLEPDVGFVRDFIKIPTRWFGRGEIWPWVFNVADSLLVVGVAVLVLSFWFDGRAVNPLPAAEPRGAAASASSAGD